MRHIAIVTTSFPQQANGSEAAGSFVADFAAALARHARVTVIAAGTDSTASEQADYAIRRFHCPRLPLSLLSPIRPTDWPAVWQTLRGGWQALEATHRYTPFDHVLALWALPCGDWARRLQRRYGVPYSIWALGSDIWTLGSVPLLRQYLASVLRDAAHCHADGLKLAADVKAISGRDCAFLPSSRLLNVPVRAAARRITPPYRLAFLGRWHPNKGVDLLLHALDLLTVEDWSRIESVTFAGGGPLEAIVHEKVDRLAAAGRPVKRLGYLDRSAATAFIQSADFLLLPSRIESIPVIFSDAMQCGTPLIATPVGDLPALMQRYHCGVLADSVRADAYAKAITEALHRPVQASITEQLALAASAFDVEASARCFLAGLDAA